MLEVENPFSGEVVCELAFDAGEALSDKVDAARGAQAEWRGVSVDERVARVRGALAFFREQRDAVARDISAQMGKPITQARAEIAGMLGRAEHMADIAAQCLAPDVLPTEQGAHRRIEHRPLGLVLDLAAWNYPLLIAVNVVVPALLAGNSVLIKHSARTPLCGLHFERAFADLEPDGLVQSLILTHAQVAALIRDRRIDHVAFTGSVEGGRAVHQEASHRFIDTGLELGGKDPAYIAADADLEAAAAGVVDGACYNAGQSCCAVERVYVHASVYGEFLDRAQRLMTRYVLGNPMDESTTMGPMVSTQAVQHTDLQTKDALARGGRLLTGGEATGDGRFYSPTLLADCPQDCDAMQEETFGPLLPVRAVASDEDALALMNDSRFGLTASVWTADRDRAERFAAALATGTVYMNRCDALDPALPWTGCGDSGKGSTLSRYGFLHLTRRQALDFRPA